MLHDSGYLLGRPPMFILQLFMIFSHPAFLAASVNGKRIIRPFSHWTFNIGNIHSFISTGSWYLSAKPLAAKTAISARTCPATTSADFSSASPGSCTSCTEWTSYSRQSAARRALWSPLRICSTSGQKIDMLSTSWSRRRLSSLNTVALIFFAATKNVRPKNAKTMSPKYPEQVVEEL